MIALSAAILRLASFSYIWLLPCSARSKRWRIRPPSLGIFSRGALVGGFLILSRIKIAARMVF